MALGGKKHQFIYDNLKRNKALTPNHNNTNDKKG